MNYFAHGRLCLDDPYLLAGTALPDWLSLVDRRVRLRPRQVEPFLHDDDPVVASMARGVARHHADDAWFHATPTFNELCWQLTITARDHLAPDESFRPSFLGHILVELLLDDCLAADDPPRLEAYYAAVAQLDGAVVETAVERLAGRDVPRLGELIPLFCRERFLFDYREDGRLLFRLNQVMRRVRLPVLPESFTSVLAVARSRVAERWRELLAAPPAAGRPQSVEPMP
ncbi:MAG: hypothetical protein K1X74_02660 [Pirellulales bacterium]|nr:hypothetical protein [Pirellulales bacterium]